ncbi:hypothetical protein V1478_014525 [Vespula squamosa]|uniref:Uncharacterized protein n=1 Tax=Vespula squamosa TaxID=30214 RepID=A0ABD2A885_VESSQ
MWQVGHTFLKESVRKRFNESQEYTKMQEITYEEESVQASDNVSKNSYSVTHTGCILETEEFFGVLNNEVNHNYEA